MLSQNKVSDSKHKTPEQESLDLHNAFPNGKIGVQVTKKLNDALHLVYSPYVAEPCMAIAKDPKCALQYTNRGNSISIISNGTAVLGLGNIGPIASIPVMEGKSALFKMLSGINCFINIIDSEDAKEIASTISRIRLTYSAINLEDISAPTCFEVCEILKNLDVPVFHDDQHGTAIVICAVITNYLNLVHKKMSDIKIVGLGAGAAALATLNMLLMMGAKRENILLFDSQGIFHKNRSDFSDQKNRYKLNFAQPNYIDLETAMQNADIFIGLSSGGKISPLLIKNMAQSPLVMALQNPNPEVAPDDVLLVRSDAIYCSGRTDFPNQVNNVLCFPYIFRVVLDFEERFTDELMLNTIKAIVDLSQEANDYGKQNIIPKPFDPLVKYMMPVYIAKHMNYNIDKVSYARHIALHLNTTLGNILLNMCSAFYIGVNTSILGFRLDKIMNLWGLKKHSEASNISKISTTLDKTCDQFSRTEICLSDIVVSRLDDKIFLEAQSDNNKLLADIAPYIPIFAISRNHKKSIIGVYRNSKEIYINHEVDFDDILICSLIFARVCQNE